MSRPGVTAGYIISPAPSWGICPLLQPSGMLPARPSGVAKRCRGHHAREPCGGPGHAPAEPVTIAHRAAQRGRTLPELCPGLSLLRRFKRHPSKHAFAATVAARQTVPVHSLGSPPSPGRGGPGLWARPRAGQPPVAAGPTQGVSTVAGLCPRALGVSPHVPPPPPSRRKVGEGRLVRERCAEQERRRKSSNTKQVSGEPKLCCFLLIMKYS